VKDNSIAGSSLAGISVNVVAAETPVSCQGPTEGNTFKDNVFDGNTANLCP
jgi:hypothetical protein